MKKILVITNMYPSKQVPSHGVFVKKTIEWLDNSFDLEVVKMSKHYSFIVKLLCYMGFYIRAVWTGLLHRYDGLYVHYISHCTIPVYIIKFFRPSLIIIGNVHGEDVLSSNGEYKLNKALSRKFLRIADGIIAPTEYFRQALSREYHYPLEKIFVSPEGGVDEKFFWPDDKDSCKKRLGYSHDDYVIGFVSRIEEGKGWDSFLECAEHIVKNNLITGVKFLMVGGGLCEREAEQYITSHGLAEHVKRLPLMSRKELHYAYNSMNIFCFPTQRTLSESLGLVGLEAMACGVPCVVSNVPGVLSYSQDGVNSLVFDAHDWHSMAGKILEIYSLPPAQREAMTRNAIKTGERYYSRNVREDFINYFRNIFGD